jgi:hypothetical protein
MGERAIEPLTTYLNQPGPDAFARAMASEGLKEIALHTPKLRETIVTTLTDYLKMPDPEERILNACVVSDLIDLSATESIDTIRDLYSKGLAELIHCGDIEEVEMALGLRSKRSTPKPDYFKDSPLRQLIPFPPSEEDEDEQHTQIDVYLSKYGTDDSILDASELDGFITAVTCSPSLIKPSAWFPAIWGGEDHMPEWADDNELESFSTAVITHYNTVLESLRKSWLLNCTQN